MLCQITSQRYQSKQTVSLKKNDFTKGTIVMDSFIRPDKIAILDTHMVVKVLGTVTDNKLDDVKIALKRFLEIT